MRPIPINSEDFERIVKRTGASECVLKTFSAPNGDLLDDDVRPVEVAAYPSELGPSYAMILLLEDDDLLKLQANGGKILYTCIGGIAPFDHEVLE